MRRASKSVCALLAEGSGRQASSDAEFRRYVVALGSVEEAKLWCAYARDLGFIDGRGAGAWQGAYEEIGRMLRGLLRRLQPDKLKT